MPATQVPAPTTSHRLTRRPHTRMDFVASDEQRAVIDNRSRRLRVLAGPGTGKTATLVESVADRIVNRGVAPEQILVLTFSRRAAAELAGRIVARLGLTTRVPIVRTLHSYAFSLVRAQAARLGEPAPRLIAAAESDLVIRELLDGNAQDGGAPWPDFLHPALRLRGFADSVRDLLARATERGLGPSDLVTLGRRRRRPEWVAVGQFAGQYSRVLDLQAGTTRQGQALDQAELMGVALGLLRVDETLAAEQSRVRRIFVDEYQDVDPAQAQLINALAAGADELVVVGDPDQSIYAFRGSDPAAMQNVQVDDTVALTIGRRMRPAITDATRRVSRTLPGVGVHRDLTGSGSGDVGPGRVEVRVLTTIGAEATYVADQLRRAHLLDGVPWSAMAVLVRSPAALLPALRRAFSVAGVPLSVPSRALPMTEDRVVAALLMVLACGNNPQSLTAERAAELMTSPLGGLDALALRRLRRALRLARPGEGSSMDVLAAVLAGVELPAGLPDDLAGAVRSVRSMVALVRRHTEDSTAEEALWELWQAAALEQPLVAASERGGLAGQRADATLDAVMLLFEAAADRGALVPGAGLVDFLDAVIGRTVEDDGAGIERAAGDAVSVLSAHASKGLEWDVVAVAGVQEGSWPNLGTRGDLLGTQDLLDAAAGLPAGTSRSASTLADERRLFYVATTRARAHLIVTAVTDTDTQPSRFLSELAGTADLPVGSPVRTDGRRERGLNVAELVADLRRTVVDPNATEGLRQRAAGHLATLSAARVRGADPSQWWGLAALSSEAAAVEPGRPVRMSPSAVENILRCSLRAVLERVGGRTAPNENQIEGIVAHALAHGIALGVPQEQLVAELDDWLAQAGKLTPWQLARQRKLILRMTDAARMWFQAQHPPWTLAGTELAIDAVVPASDPADFEGGELPPGLSATAATRPVVLAGRLDWLSHDEAGRAVVVDFKTTASPRSKADVEANPQLASYQIAIEQSPDHPAPGGAQLVYLKKGATVREQAPLTAERRATWIGTIRSAADALADPRQTATANTYCDICSVRTSCPLQPDGRQVL